jgi:YVTN family beta-propeller protein
VGLATVVLFLTSAVPMASAAPFAYVANTSSATVSVIDGATSTVVATIHVGAQPFGVAVNSTGTRAYVANFGDNTISVIDTSTNTVVATVPVGNAPTGVAVNAAGTAVYVANGDGTV